jgi:hypothetical protein
MSLKLLLEEVFVTEGVPEFTFVPPPNYNQILLDIRRRGKPVILEGQSGTGKTTCVRRILEELNDPVQTQYLTARNPAHVAKIRDVVADQSQGRFVIDDFHRLSNELQERIADTAKLAAELGNDAGLPKLIIIGINQVGSELIQLVPDIAKRTGIHKIDPGTKQDVSALINAGCERLNIEISGIDQIFNETRGDYWLTQQICQSICATAGVTSTQDDKRPVVFTMAEIRSRVVERLRSAYYPAVKEFCRGRRFRPSNDPYFKLLRAVGQQDSSIVDLNEMANSQAEVRGSINNIKERRLEVLIESKPAVARNFYYNAETKNFAMEDPALFYFIRHLNWDQLRQDCGFRDDNPEVEYDIAVSFAGENRELARYIAESLEKVDVHVFFDEMYEANFLGKAWSKEFARVFSSASRFVLCILDAHHHRKIWPTFEREVFVPRVADETVIPVFLDQTKFAGIPQDIVGIHFKFDTSDANWQSQAYEKILSRVIDRLST